MKVSFPKPLSEHLPSLERIGAFLFAWRNLVFSAGTILLLACLRPQPLLGNPHLDRYADAFGILLLLLGQGLRVAVIGYAYIKRGGTEGKVDAPRLVTGGFFRHCRNPLYLGNILVLAGLFVVHNNPWGYVFGLPLGLFAYSAIVATEESFLQQRFGEAYTNYCRRVPRWIPDFRHLRQSLSRMRFNAYRVMVKEYTTVFSWFTGLLALLAYQELTFPSALHRPAYFRTLGIMWSVAFIAWAIARYVKKTEKRRQRRKERLTATD